MTYNTKGSGAIKYQGLWAKGRKEGYGNEIYKIVDKNVQSKYVGIFKDNLKHGHGVTE